VLEFAIAAAKEAASLHAHREAAAQYARALRFAADKADGQREPLLTEWQREAFLTGQMADAMAAAEALLDIARRAGDRVKQAESLTLLGSAMVYAGRNSDAEDASRSALALIDTEPSGRAHAAAYQLQASLRMLNRDLGEAIAWAEHAMAAAERVGDREIHARALNTIGSARLLTGDEVGMADLKRSLELARDAGWDEGVSAALSNLGSALGEMYLFGSAAAHLQEGIAFAKERDLDTSYNVSWLALVRAFQGQWEEAAELAGTVIDNPAAMAISRTMALVALGRVRARRGDPEVWITLDAALELALPTGTLQRLAPVRAARAEAAWLTGDLERTRAEARAALDLALHHRHQWHSGELTYWLSQAGELHEPQPYIALPYDRQIAGDWEGAAAAWRALGCPYEEARALAESDDSTLIRRALSTFEALGATPAIGQATRRLRALGMRDLPPVRRGPRASTRANPAGLTRREAEVLALLTEGLSTAAIAERLYLTPKTVRHYVSAILGKLDVETRAEAVRAVQLGIIPS
jgi:DNA-binding CsgD family transcriptional regulator/tetratricopeptide (TPR) repeat protein